jgi:hypothetical protein
VGFQSVVDELGLLLGELLLAADIVWEVGESPLQDLAGDVDT